MPTPKSERVAEFLRQSNAIEREYSEMAYEDAMAAWTWVMTYNHYDLSNGMILEIHRLLMRRLNLRIAGQLRTIGVMVGGRICPDAREVSHRLDIWLEEYGKVRTAQAIKNAHVAFEHIHPFEDGNGRTGRILMNFQRVRARLPILVIHEGKEQMKYYTWF